MATPFDRDLGYLMPFLDKLEQHAASLSPEARAELETLVAEQRQRWSRIRTLLEGNAAPAATESASTESAPTKSEKKSEKKSVEKSEKKPEKKSDEKRDAKKSKPSDAARRAFTIGSLRSQD
jgi:hypothetical protein